MKGVGRLIRRALPYRQTCQSLFPSQLNPRRLIFFSSRTPSLLVVGNPSSFLSSNFESLTSSLLPLKWTHFRGWSVFCVLALGLILVIWWFSFFWVAGQRRNMFIQTQSTPNPSSLMFYPGKAVMEVGSADFPNARSALNSPLAKALYGIDGKKLTLIILSGCSWMSVRVRIADYRN